VIKQYIYILCFQVALAFWNAIGGDDDEIDDLDSDWSKTMVFNWNYWLSWPI